MFYISTTQETASTVDNVWRCAGRFLKNRRFLDKTALYLFHQGRGIKRKLIEKENVSLPVTTQRKRQGDRASVIFPAFAFVP